MGDDFEGALEDVEQADKDDDDSGDESQEGDRLEQQMGEAGPEAEAVDERMWGPQDEKEPGPQQQEPHGSTAVSPSGNILQFQLSPMQSYGVWEVCVLQPQASC